MNTNQNTETSTNKLLKILIILVLTTIVIMLFTGILSIRFGFNSAHLAEKLNIFTATKETDKTNTDTKIAENLNSQTTNQTDDLLAEHKETLTLVIPPKQQLNYWLAMERDYDLDYSWNTDGKPVYGELRGKHNDVNSTDVKVFAKTTSDKAHGFFIVPFTGHFGWYWDNKTDKPITIRFTIKGAYKILDNPGQPPAN